MDRRKGYVRGRFISPEQRAELKEKFQSRTHSIGMLSREYSLPYTTVYRIVFDSKNAVPDRHERKLTPELVRKIREEFAKGDNLRTLADRYAVTRMNISYIVRRKTWAWVV